MEPTSNQPVPLSFAELLRRTFRIYQANFMTIISLVAFVTIPISLLNIIISPQPLAALTTSAASLSDTPDMSSLLLSLLSLIQTILITAPLTYLASEYLFGRKLTVSEAFSGVSHRFGQIGCGVLFIGIIAFFIIFVFFSLAIAFPPALLLSGILLHIIIATSALMFPVLTLETIGASAAFSRSWSLGKRRFWAAFGVSVIAVLIALLINSVIGGIITTAIMTVSPNMNNNVKFLIINIISDVVSIFVAPISPIAFTLIYYNIRTTTEGLVDVLNTGTTVATRPVEAAPLPARFQFDRHDWRNIVILSVLGLIGGIVANILLQPLMQQLATGLR